MAGYVSLHLFAPEVSVRGAIRNLGSVLVKIGNEHEAVLFDGTPDELADLFEQAAAAARRNAPGQTVMTVEVRP